MGLFSLREGGKERGENREKGSNGITLIRGFSNVEGTRSRRENTGNGRRGKIQIPGGGVDHVQRSEAAPAVVGAATLRNSIKVLAHGPKEMPFSRISRSLSGGTTAYVGPGATRAIVHGRERSQCSL